MRCLAPRTAALAAALTVVAGCTTGDGNARPRDPASPSQGPATSPTPGTTSAAGVPQPAVVGTIATGLDVPWGLAFLPDGSALVSERDTARILRITPDGAVTAVGTVPGVTPTSEGGLLGLAVSPSYDSNHLIYAYLTTATDNRVVAMTYDEGRIGPPRPLLTGIPRGELHDGGRLAFGPDGMLYVSTGETHEEQLAQDIGSLGGKILRITPVGDPAPGNPEPDSPVWSYGHRNIEGLAFGPAGRLWASEFGESTWDELNLIRKGGNYGWPEVEGRAGRPGLIDPKAQWSPEEASPAGLAYAEGALWMAALRGERLWRIQVQGSRVVGEPRAFFTGDYGRLRTVAVAPDGSLWLTTSNTDGRGDPAPGDDRILRIVLR